MDRNKRKLSSSNDARNAVQLPELDVVEAAGPLGE
jgi:hypothetical protein